MRVIRVVRVSLSLLDFIIIRLGTRLRIRFLKERVAAHSPFENFLELAGDMGRVAVHHRRVSIFDRSRMVENNDLVIAENVIGHYRKNDGGGRREEGGGRWAGLAS